MELDPPRRRRAFICSVVACVCFAALALMNAFEPSLFPGRQWDVSRGITVAGLVWGAGFFGWLAWIVREKR